MMFPRKKLAVLLLILLLIPSAFSIASPYLPSNIQITIPKVSAQALALDGHVVATSKTTSATTAASLTTTSFPDVIIAACGTNRTGESMSVSASGLTWHSRFNLTGIGEKIVLFVILPHRHAHSLGSENLVR